jgi:hypothetical protein
MSRRITIPLGIDESEHPATLHDLARIMLTCADAPLVDGQNYHEPEPYIGVAVTVSASEQDGAPIVQIDTDGALEGANGEPQIRVYVNDWRAFGGRPRPAHDPQRRNEPSCLVVRPQDA